MLSSEKYKFVDNHLAIYNPFSKSEVGRVRCNTDQEIEDALELVGSYQHDLPAFVRSRILKKCADLLEQEAEDFALQITSESGVCLHESAKEVARSVNNLRIASEETMRIHGEALQLSTESGDKIAVTVREPVGVVAAITPFNRPLNQVVVKLAPAIAANNAVIVKPSEKTPLTCLMLKELTMKAGLPDAMFQVVIGEPYKTANTLIDAPQTNLVTFTGSVSIGTKVAQRTGLKKVLLELGGNDPMLLLADADIDATAKITADGATATAGQACRGVKRVLVPNQIAEAFIDRLKRIIADRPTGDPFDPGTRISCMIGESEAIEAVRRCHDAVNNGARIVYGGKREAAMLQPTILDHVPADCDLVRLETFAPIVPIIRYDSLDQAIDIINSTQYGLQAGVATNDICAFMKIAGSLKVGAVNLMEGPQFDSPHIPFGGVKASGIGREGIRYAIQEMTTVKTVVMPALERLAL